MKLTETCERNAKAHFQSVFPNEGCGIVTEAGRFIACENTHETPRTNFSIDAAVFVKYKVAAVLHSHPYVLGELVAWPVIWPSGSDVQGHIDTAVPWGICSVSEDHVSDFIWMDDNDRAELVGRPFVSGLWDCYGAVRDWFHFERGIDIPNFARGMDWWFKADKNGRQYDLFTENFEKAGFVEIPMDEVQVGDCYLFKARSKVINHCAVITAPNEIFHHVFMRGGDAVSRHDDAGQWAKMVVKAVRYTGGSQ